MTKVRSIDIRRFRSIDRSGLSQCGGLNVLIGKNNAGKSNVLSTVELMHRHLARGTIAGPWDVARASEEFTDRDTTRPIQVGIAFELPEQLNVGLRERLKAESPHLEKSIEQIKAHESIAFVLAAARKDSTAFLYIEQIAVGTVKNDAQELGTQGMSLLQVSQAVAYELFLNQQQATELRGDVRVLEALMSDTNRLSYVFENRERAPSFLLQGLLGPEVRPSPSLTRQIGPLAAGAQSLEEFRSRLAAVTVDSREKAEKLEHRETEGAIGAFAGATKTPPTYATWLMREYGLVPMLHLRETREPIGREEAEALLNLKVTRGGPERLASVQSIVRSLLGVEVDAFQAEQRRQTRAATAEMDVDKFLVEANGAGVREALRLVLDLELKKPALLLLEEPEAHLHPGLEHAVYTYLRDKSRETQMFVTTHSTNFIDSVSFQNIYLVSRDKSKRTVCQAVDPGDGALKIPAELGLRLSTVFMYDALVFVEGPSDEAVLRELAKTLSLDLTRANVGFVQMGGVKNFAHFAAQATIELLSRRRIRMWFVTDRDEKDDAEVNDMIQRLGPSAKLTVLERRELENYLLNPVAVADFIQDKQRAAGTQLAASTEAVEAAIMEQARELKNEVIRLRVDKDMLKPVVMHSRTAVGTVEERLKWAADQLAARLTRLESDRARITAEVGKNWDSCAADKAPGGLVLDAVAKKFGVRFVKDKGDSARLAQLVGEHAIPDELKRLLREFAQSAIS